MRLKKKPQKAGGSVPRRLINLEHYVPAYLTFIANKWSRSASRLYLSQFGIGIEAWRIIVLLAIEKSITANRICQVIFMDKASVSRSLKNLEALGLIEFKDDPSDARQRFIELTTKGLAIHDEIIGIALARETRLLACLSDEEQETLTHLLARVHANLDVLDDDH